MAARQRSRRHQEQELAPQLREEQPQTLKAGAQLRPARQRSRRHQEQELAPQQREEPPQTLEAGAQQRQQERQRSRSEVPAASISARGGPRCPQFRSRSA